jgi:DnaJ like chaperone protein
MSYWGRLLGGMAGFAMGGPFGAVVGAALGHAAEQGALPRISTNFTFGDGSGPLHPARLAAAVGGREQVFAVAVVVLSAKLAKCDGAVARSEIDAFKRQFRIPPESVRDIGRLFDQARDSTADWRPYATQLGQSFADNRGLLEDVLAALFAIARADKPLTRGEHDMLRGIHGAFGLDNLAWDQASGATSRSAGGRGAAGRGGDGEVDAYAALGMTPAATDEELRGAWLRLMRENHPDSLAARGVPAEFIARAGDKVARINAAWDRIKRERRL